MKTYVYMFASIYYRFLLLAIILIMNKKRNKLLNSSHLDYLNVKLHPVIKWLIYISVFLLGGILEAIIVYYLLNPVPKHKMGEYDYKNGQLVFIAEDTNQQTPRNNS